MREVLMNEKTNLLQLEEHFYQLVNVVSVIQMSSGIL